MAKSRPVITISAAVSIDGKIATKTGDSKLSSKKDLIRLHKLRSKMDAVLVGTNTLHRDDPLLTVRYTNGKNPTRIILDSKATIPLDSKILKTCKQIDTIIVVSKLASRTNLRRLEKFPVTIIVAGTTSQINLKLLLKKLVAMKITTLLVEGGGTLNWDFVRQGLYDKLVVTVSPRIIGGTNSISLVEGSGFSKIANSSRLRLEKTQKTGNEIVLYYSQSVS